MITFQNSIPDYYMKESRDFQLFPRLDDITFLGIYQDIDTITELNNPKKCKNSHLTYLAEKVGFYTNEYIPDIVLANIISSFRTALKNKGTLEGIKQAVIAILKAENSIEPPRIEYIKDAKDYWESYVINIYTPIKIINEIALKEFLKYIIPAGHNYNLYIYEKAGLGKSITTINTAGVANTVKTSNVNIGIVRSALNRDIMFENELKDLPGASGRLLGTADIGMVMDADDIFGENTIETDTIIDDVLK